ncbi:glycosyltransferase [Erythrobacter arachoides]|uniref:Glycosyltransferase n=1 Tax=Aurantiacibacter arachoides TaxID=1850444 RepID=A0A845A2G8_9SPHN|nr:glycosyltransferase [Aurantiacibacter arachoides]MXO93894.1 glycosyltransferase [Aurantiacibacter arachoides]GGD45849.1 hypothetical protein GCM10011411_01810 [Aurantiacibacter arachoides]
MNDAHSQNINKILASKMFAEKVNVARIHSHAPDLYAHAIAVPVRDEEELLPRMLNSLLVAMRGSTGGALVFVINDTRDRSAAIIETAMRNAGQSYLMVELSLAASIRDAPHARRLALDLAAMLAPEGKLLTTDADSYVGPDWVASRLQSLSTGNDLVCEDVHLDDDELSLLPPQVRAVGDAERAYFEASDRLWRSWTGGEAGSFAYRASGASLAIRSTAYRAIGGLPTPPVGEDVALCAAMLAAGMRVVTSNDGGTRTSARLQARAEGGCGACLTSRALANDPPCDAALVPLSILRERAALARGARLTGASANSAIWRGQKADRAMLYSEVLVELERARTLEQALVDVDA